MKNSVREILNAFISKNSKKKVFGNYRIENNELVYRAQSSEKLRVSRNWSDVSGFNEFRKEVGNIIKEKDGRLVDESGKQVMLETLTVDSKIRGALTVEFYETNRIAVRAVCEKTGKEILFGNKDTLDLIGRTVSYGNESRNSGLTEIQVEMQKLGFHFISLSSFPNLSKGFQFLDKGEPSQVEIESQDYGSYRYNRQKIKRGVNYSALLFKLGNETYLCDLDRRETRYNKLNSFCTAIDTGIETISAAYDSLKPDAVIEAESKGIKTYRIGKAFFIATPAPEIPELSVEEKLCILADNKGYSISDSVIDRIVGMNKDRIESISENAILKVPQKTKIKLGRGLSVETAIRLNGKTYCTGIVESNNRANLDLKTWTVLIDENNSEIEREIE